MELDLKELPDSIPQQQEYIWDIDSENSYYDVNGTDKVFCIFSNGQGRFVPAKTKGLFINCNKNFGDWTFEDFKYYLEEYPPKWFYSNPLDSDAVAEFIKKLITHEDSIGTPYYVFTASVGEGGYKDYFKFEDLFVGTNDPIDGIAMDTVKQMEQAQLTLRALELKDQILGMYFILFYFT